MAVEGAETGRAGFANAVRVLRIYNYKMYAVGNAVSLVGIWMQRLAVGWLAWQLTHSTFWLGMIAAADLTATIVFSPLAGVLADRVDRMRLIQATQLATAMQAAVLAALTLSGAMTIALLFLLTLALGIANALNQPARLALVPSLVDQASLPAANAVSALAFNLARFLGPALAGAVINTAGVGAAFALNALGCLVFVATLQQVRLAPRASRREGAVLEAALAGYSYALRHPGIGRIIAVFTVTALSIRGFNELFPGFVDTVFARGPAGLAGLTAMIGLGALGGGLFMVRRSGVAGLTRLFMAHSALAAAAVLGFAATTSYWLALLCVLVWGFAVATTGIGAQTLIQSAVDPAMRGRVLGLYGMLFRGGVALNAVLMGSLSAVLDMRLVVGTGAVLCLLYWGWARLRQGGMVEALEAEARRTAAAP